MDIFRRKYETKKAVENFKGFEVDQKAVVAKMSSTFRKYKFLLLKKLKKQRVRPNDTCVQSMYTMALTQSQFISLKHAQMNKVCRWFYKITDLLGYPTSKNSVRSRPHSIRVCLKCNVYRTVNKEKATAACESCGSCCSFASHIFEIREDKYGTIDTGIRSNSKTDYIDQYERNFASINLNVLDVFRDAYSRFIHVRDTAKVTSTRTKQFIKRLKLPKYLYNCLERLNRELRGEPIPEFDISDIQLIVDQQEDLKRLSTDILNDKKQIEHVDTHDSNEQDLMEMGDDDVIMGDTSNSKKTQHVQVTTRKFALSNGFEQGHLLNLQKTNAVHYANTRQLAKFFDIQQSRRHNKSNYRGNRVPSWKIV